MEIQASYAGMLHTQAEVAESAHEKKITLLTHSVARQPARSRIQGEPAVDSAATGASPDSSEPAPAPPWCLGGSHECHSPASCSVSCLAVTRPIIFPLPSCSRLRNKRHRRPAATLKAEIEELHQQLDDAEQTQRDLRDALMAAENDAAEARGLDLEEARRYADELQETLTQREEEAVQMTGELGEAQAARDELAAELSTARADAAASQDRVQELEKQASEAEALHATVAGLQARVEAQVDLEATIEQLKGQLAAQATENEKSSQAVAGLEAAKEELNASLAAKTRALTAAERKMAGLEQTVETLRRHTTDLEQQTATLKTELADMLEEQMERELEGFANTSAGAEFQRTGSIVSNTGKHLKRKSSTDSKEGSAPEKPVRRSKKRASQRGEAASEEEAVSVDPEEGALDQTVGAESSAPEEDAAEDTKTKRKSRTGASKSAPRRATRSRAGKTDKENDVK